MFSHLKFSFSKKATKICAIFFIVWTFTYRSVNFKSKVSSQNFFQKTNQRICFSILTTYQDRKTTLIVRFLEEVLVGKFVFNFYWPLVKAKIIRKIPQIFVVFSEKKNFNVRSKKKDLPNIRLEIFWCQ